VRKQTGLRFGDNLPRSVAALESKAARQFSRTQKKRSLRDHNFAFEDFRPLPVFNGSRGILVRRNHVKKALRELRG
jgi:hypothetical protein